MSYKKINYITGFVILFITTFVYLLTVPPTITFWESGEIAANAYTLSISHSIAPLWIIIGKIATFLPFISDPALKINIISSIISGFTVFFLYHIIVKLILNWRGEIINKFDAFFVFGSASIGAFSFAFSDSFWNYSHTTTVYPFSIMLISLCILLILKWWENYDKKGNERFLLLISFIIALSSRTSPSALIIIYAVGFLYYFKNFEYSKKTFSFAFIIVSAALYIIYSLAVNWYPSLLAGNIHFLKIHSSLIIKWLAILLIPVLIILTYYVIRQEKKDLSLALISLVLVLIGYGIFNASFQKVNIDNLHLYSLGLISSPVNVEQNDAPFLTRRYSNQSEYVNTWKNYSSDLDFTWRYQINHMFTRYLGQQFIGKAGYEQDSGIDLNKFYAIPFIIGLFGLFYQFRKNWKFGVTFLWLFLVFGVLSALYFKQQDAQPRERDYLYLGAYFIFSIWIGIGIIGLIELFNAKKHFISGLILVLSFILVPLNLVRVNFLPQNQSKNYIVFDYAYNMLQSIDKNGILFTNGDNDTYPLWYLQTIGYRTDVKVININLLNDKSYIKRIKNISAYDSLKITINLTNEQIDSLKPIQWEDFKLVKIDVPNIDTVKLTNKLTWKVPASYENDSKVLSTADLLILDIIRSNIMNAPIYFSKNIPDENCLGLSKFLVTEGIAKKLVPYPEENDKQYLVDNKLYENLMTNPVEYSHIPKAGFFFHGINCKSSFFNQVSPQVVHIYRLLYLELAYNENDSIKIGEILNKMESNLPANIFPIDYKLKHNLAMLYARIGNKQKFNELSRDVEIIAKDLLNNDPNDIQSPWNPYKLLLDIYETKGEYQNALNVLSKLESVVPNSPEVKSKIDAIKSKMNGNDNK